MVDPEAIASETNTDECFRTESPPLKTCDKCGFQGSFQQIRLIRRGLKRGEKPNQSTWGYKCVNRQCGMHFGSSYRFNKETLTYVECQHDGTPLPSPEASIVHAELPVEEDVERMSYETLYDCSEVPCTSISFSDGNDLEQSSTCHEIINDITATPLFSSDESSANGINTFSAGGIGTETSNVGADDTVDINTGHNENVLLSSVSKNRGRRTQRVSKKSYAPPRPIVRCASDTKKTDGCALAADGSVPECSHSSEYMKSKTQSVTLSSSNVNSLMSGIIKDSLPKMNDDSGKDANIMPSLKRLPKGYAYEPIESERVTVVEEQPAPQGAIVQCKMINDKPRIEAYDEGTQTGCDVHKRIIALENIATDHELPSAGNSNILGSSLLSRTLRNSQTIIKEQRSKIDQLEKEKRTLLDTLTNVKPCLRQFTQDNKLFLDNVKADVDHLSKELKFFKMESQSEAQCSFNIFKEKQKKMEEILRYRTAERNKYKAQMDLSKGHLDQCKKTAESLQLDMDEKDLEVRQAKKNMEEIEKKLTDSMWIRTNQRCLKCKATESSQKTLIQEVIEAKNEVKKVGRELGANKSKTEELERQNEWMAAEMQRLNFEHRAYKKDNERLLAENEQFRKGLVPRALQLQMTMGTVVAEGPSDVVQVQTNGCVGTNIFPDADAVDARSNNEFRGAENRLRTVSADKNLPINCQDSDSRASRQDIKMSPKLENGCNRSSQERDKGVHKRENESKVSEGDSSRKRPSTSEQRMDNKIFKNSDSGRPQSVVSKSSSERDEKRQSLNDYSRSNGHTKRRSPPKNQHSSRNRPSSREHSLYRERRSPREHGSAKDRSLTREHAPFRESSSKNLPPRVHEWERLPAWEHPPNRDCPRPMNEQLQPWDRIPSQLPHHRNISPSVLPVHGHQQTRIYEHPHGSVYPLHPSQSGSSRVFIDTGLPWSRGHDASGGFSGPPQDANLQDPNVRRSFWDRF